MSDKKYTGSERRAARMKAVRFDSTITAGHIMTAVTIIFCSLGAWYDMKSSVYIVKEENVRQAAQIEKVDTERKQKEQSLGEQILTSGAIQNQNVTKLRDDMNQWFIRINDKLDTKQDKRYK